MKFKLLLILSIFLAACSFVEHKARGIAPPSGSPKWGMEGANASKTSQVDSTIPDNINENHRILELRPYSGDYPWIETSTPLVIDGAVIYGTSAKEVVAMEWKSDQVLWRVKTPGRVFSSPAYGDGKIFVCDLTGLLMALSTKGEILWKLELEHPVYSSPIYSEGKVFVFTASQNAFAVNANDGTPLWQFASELKDEGSIWRGTSLCVDGGRVYLGLDNGTVVALESDVGRLVWKKKIDDEKAFGDVVAGPAVSGDLVYAGTRHKMTALEKSSGKTIWSKNFGATGGVSIGDEYLYFGTPNGAIACVKKSDGEPVWNVPLNGGVATWPVLGADGLVVGATEGSLFVLSPSNGKVLQEVAPGSGISGQPWLGDEGMAFISNIGYLHRFSRGD